MNALPLLVASLVCGSSSGGTDLREALFPQLGPKTAAAEEEQAPASAQLKLAAHYAKERDEALVAAQRSVDDLFVITQQMKKLVPGTDWTPVKKRLKRLQDTELGDAEQALLRAVELEGKRVRMTQKALLVAQQKGERVSGLDEKELRSLADQLGSGAAAKQATAYVQGMRALAGGLMAFLDNDLLFAIEELRRAEALAPELAPVHLYLGSLLYLTGQKQRAVDAWRRALELEPDNQELRRAIADVTSGSP